MRTRRLGQSSLEVPVVCFGAWAIGGWQWGGTDDALAVAALRAGLDLGITAIDTAPIYGFGHSERIVGGALAGRRDEALVLTKAGLRWDDARGEAFFDAAGPDGERCTIYRNSRPDSLRHEVEASLARLGIERIDLLQIHWPDPTTPIADTMGALKELRAEGKLREIGVSNYTPAMMDEARAALGEVPLASDQPKYNLVAREMERDVLPYARDNGIGLLVYSPLEQGLLTGKVGPDRTFPPGDNRAKRPTLAPKNRAKVNAVLQAVVAPIAAKHDATLGQIVIAWTVDQPGVTAALVGARRERQVQENAAAGDIELAPEDWQAIDRAFAALELDPNEKPATGGWRGALRRILKR